MAGARVNVPAQVKPLIDKTVAEQIAAVQARIRNDPALRAERAGAMGQGLPLDPAAGHRRRLVAAGAVAGTAADPRDRRAAARRCLGGDADARHRGGDPHHAGRRPSPICPFPATIAIVPPTPGGVSIGVPIDMPFTEINKIVEAQFAGKTFPEDGSGSVDVTVKRASVAASGDRLLISLLVNAKEKKSFFGFGGEANVHIWGRPVLDQAAADAAADRHRTRGRIRSRVRAARRRGARGDAASAEGAGRQGDRSTSSRSPAMRRRRSPP